MRIRDGSIFVRKERPVEFRRNYFIAFEGYTEYRYFEGVKTHREQLGIGSTVDIQLLDRFDLDQSDSDPRSISAKMRDYRRLISEGVYSVGIFSGEILQQVFDIRCSKMKGQSKKICHQEIVKLHSELNELLETSEYAENGYLKDRSWEDAALMCEEYLRDRFSGEVMNLQTPPDRRIETFDEDTDVFCLVVDRDKGSRSARYYRYLMKECSENRISLYVSNPCFEFWLLLHYDESLDLSTEQIETLKSDEKVECGKEVLRTSMRMLCDVLPNYEKGNLRFETDFLNRIDKAVENAESYETAIEALKDNVGSNVGLLIERIRANN